MLKNWIEAFDILRRKLSDYPKDKKMVLFFDEFPWFDTQKSDFLSAFEWFWNDWGVLRIILFVLFVAQRHPGWWNILTIIKAGCLIARI